MYHTMAREVESDRPLWAVVLVGGHRDRSSAIARVRQLEEAAARLLRDILAEDRSGQAFPAVHLGEFMEALYTRVVRHWPSAFRSLIVWESEQAALSSFSCAR
jgi:hypothetical protein